MAKFSLPKPLNHTQRVFAELCAKGGGIKGGPARTRVQELLKESGQQLNKLAKEEIEHALEICSDRNPWHVCFAVGVAWGHLAILNDDYLVAAVNCLENLHDHDLKIARSYHFERGALPVEQSLKGGYQILSTIAFPEALPSSLKGMRTAQERLLGRILSKDRPKYIGAWNATAMFMVAFMSNDALKSAMTTAEVILPPGGPIHAALSILHQTHVLPKKPEGSELDDESFEPGAIHANTGLMEDLAKGCAGWDLLDVHSGLYLLGTRYPDSDKWLTEGLLHAS